VFLDFESDKPFRAPKEVDYAFVIAAATNYERCVRDPAARVINVELIPRLIAGLLEQGIFVSFISSNAVFGGERPWPHEDDPHAPAIAYAQQKSDGERATLDAAGRLGASDRLGIVRLTKILNWEVPPLPGWLAAWQQSKAIEPFSDLIFAPLSAEFAGESLATLGEKRIAGNLHLSGADNITYVDFARALARKLKISESLIAPTTAVAKGIEISFKPTYSGLGMIRTTKLSGIKPQSLDDLINGLFGQMPEQAEGR
jgi:dTDP-4-dehydrorhamnose reductase